MSCMWYILYFRIQNGCHRPLTSECTMWMGKKIFTRVITVWPQNACNCNVWMKYCLKTRFSFNKMLYFYIQNGLHRPMFSLLCTIWTGESNYHKSEHWNACNCDVWLKNSLKTRFLTKYTISYVTYVINAIF